MECSFDIIVPMYNAEKTVERMINSFVAQNYSRYQLHLVDDGSTDGTELTCKKYVDAHSNIKYYKQINKGPGAARKLGFLKADADYVLFCDADDYVEDGLLNDLNRCISESTADVIEFGFRKITTDGRVLKSLALKDEIVTSNCLEHYIKQNNTTNYLWNKAFRRSLISSHDFVNLYYSEDACFLANVMNKAINCVIIGKQYYNYVISKYSACGSKVNEKRLDVVKADKYIMELLKDGKKHLQPYAACTACSHSAHLYGMFSVKDSLSASNSELLLNQFHENYEILKPCKRHVYRISSLKRKVSIELFNISSKAYVQILKLGDL